MLEIVYHHHPHNEEPGLSPEMDQSLCGSMWPCAYIELLVHGSFKHYLYAVFITELY